MLALFIFKDFGKKLYQTYLGVVGITYTNTCAKESFRKSKDLLQHQLVSVR